MSARPTQQFVKGQTILQEGSEGDRTYKILAGEVLICKQNSAADLVPIAKLGAGEIFGEMYLFDGRKSRSATVIAASNDVVVEIFFQDEMQGMLDRLSPSMLSILHGFSKRLRSTSHHCVELAATNKQLAKLPDGTIKQTGTSIRRTQ